MQVGREYDHLKRIYNERESRQGANQFASAPVSRKENGASGKDLPEAPKKPTQKAAAAIGVSRRLLHALVAALC
jgi:hypothetical protein